MVPALFSNECGADECGAVQLITLVRMAIFAAGTALNAPKCTEMSHLGGLDSGVLGRQPEISGKLQHL